MFSVSLTKNGFRRERLKPINESFKESKYTFTGERNVANLVGHVIGP